MKNAGAFILALVLIACAAAHQNNAQTATEGSAASLMDRARVLAAQGRNEEALAAADAAVAAEPQDFGLPVGRGEVLEQLGRRAEAEESYRAGLRVFELWLGTSTAEEAAHYLRYHTLVLTRLGRTPEAIALVDAELRRSGRQGRLLALRCEIRVEANVEIDRGLTDCNEALAIEPGSEAALVARGLAFLRKERWVDAERDFTALLTLSPANPDALYGRGLARQRLHNALGAARDIAAARQALFYIDAEFERRGLRQAP